MRVATQYAPARCTPDAAAQLQPLPYACGAQRTLLPMAVGAMTINELMNSTRVRHNIPTPLQVNLLTLKVVSESSVTWATSVPILVFLFFLFSSYSRCTRQADRRQTGRRQTASSLNAPA